MSEKHLVWLRGTPDPSRIEAQVWHGPMAQFVSAGNSATDPRLLTSFEIDAGDHGLSLRHLKAMEKYALPACFKTTIEPNKKIETKPKLTKDEADRLGVTVDGKPKKAGD